MSATRLSKYREQGRRDGVEGGLSEAVAQQLRDALATSLGVSPEEAQQQTIANYRERLAALPNEAHYPELRGMRECVEAYNDGAAEGAGVPLDVVVLRANYLPMMVASMRVAAPTPTSEPGCTLVYFGQSDRGPLLANNLDGLAAHQHHVPPPWIVGNREGLVLGTVSSGVFDDEVSPQLFPAPVFMMAQEMCGSVDEAVELLTRLNLFWGPCNLLIADRHGSAAVIEKSTCRYGLRRVEDGFAATTEMSAQTSEQRAYLWETRERSLQQRGLDRDSADWAYWVAAEQRSERLQTLLDEARAEPTFEAIENMIYDHIDSPEQVHMDGSLCHPDQTDAEWSLRTTIWVLEEQRAQFSWAEPPVSGHLTPRQWKAFEDIEPVF